MRMNSLACKFYRSYQQWTWQTRKFILHQTRREYTARTLNTLSKTGFNDYEQERRSWNISIPDKFNFASDILDVWARKEKEGLRNASIPAFWYVSDDGKELKWNYQNLETETKRTANMLEKHCGLQRQDNVLLMLPKVPEFWLVNVAAIRTGVVLSPCSMMLTAKDLAYRFSVFKPSSIIAHESIAEIVDEVAPSFPSLKSKVIVSEKSGSRKGWLDFHNLQHSVNSDHKCADTSSDESMMVFFTSGTTGQPKMVEHTHASYGMGHILTGKYVLDLTQESIIWNMSDTGWAKTAYSSIFAPWLLGSCVFIHRMPRFSASLTFQVLSQYPIDTFCAPPMVFRAMVQENLADQNFCKLSLCISGGEPITSEVIKRWEANTGLRIYEAYGQTETVVTIGMFKCLDHKPGSCGKPLPGMDVVILDENENELGPGIKGEIALKRKQDQQIFGLFKGYRGDPKKTKECITEKYYHTGDMAYYDEDGYFWFVGRNDDLINSAGYRIGPYEVESALMEHPAIAEVAVTSSPDPERGEVVKAFIVLSEKYLQKSEAELTKELQEHTKKITAPYKYPRKIDFVKELPKTTSGKIKRFELKDMEWKKIRTYQNS